MKTKSESNDKKTKDSLDDTIEHFTKVNPYFTMFHKYNLDFLNRLYKNIFKTKINHYKIHHKKQNKVFKKSDEINEPCNSDISEKSVCTDESPGDDIKKSIDVLPVSGHDICNYLARYGMTNCQIQAVMKLDGKLNFEKLKRAVRLSVDEEPVFACRFIEDDPPYWKRLDNIDETTFCTLEETDNSDEAAMKFLQSPLDMDNDPNVKVKLIRSNQHDILGVKLNHACCDETGAKEYIQLLSNIYSCIDEENDTFETKPRIDGRQDQDRLFRELRIKHSELRWNPISEKLNTPWPFPWKQRGGNSVCFSTSRLPKGSLESIHNYGKSKGAEVNDLILTAFYRAMFKISRPIYGIPLSISSTIDLRRYLPEYKTQAIRNFSGSFTTKIARIMNEPFETTLTRVMQETKKIKDGNPGLNNALGGEYVKKASFTYFNNYFKPMFQGSETKSENPDSIGNACYPALSNLGYISNSLIRFGKNAVTDAYIIPPAVHAPGFLLLVSTYNDILTLSEGYYRGSILQKDMDNILVMIKNELMRVCTSHN